MEVVVESIMSRVAPNPPRANDPVGNKRVWLEGRLFVGTQPVGGSVPFTNGVDEPDGR